MGGAIKDYELRYKFRNNLLLTHMRRAGINSVPQLSAISGVNYASVLDILNLKIPLYKKGSDVVRDPVKRVADALRALPEDIIPPQHHRKELRENSGGVELSFDQVQSLIGYEQADPCEQLLIEERNAAIEKALCSLPDREEAVIRMHVFDDATLDEIGEKINTSGAEVKKIYVRGLRMLRHPSRSRALR
jgi:RNA polymerase sigma factor (sigma-70 family)